MKDFDEFRKLMSVDYVNALFESASEAGRKFSWPITEENIDKFASALAASNLVITMSLLQKYHEWLGSDE